MKILNASQLKAADAYTIENEPIASINLMERAAQACEEWLMAHYSPVTRFVVVCGMGNNGGDGLAIARLLHEKRRDTCVFIAPYFSNATADFIENRKRYEQINKEGLKEIRDGWMEHFKNIDNYKPVVIIDAILGSGLSRPAEGELGELLLQINSLHYPVIAVDMPSGLMMDGNSGTGKIPIIKATVTLTFETPKLSFLFAENYQFTGEFQVLDIGINKPFLNSQKTSDYFTVGSDMTPLLKKRNRFSHKGNYGHAFLIAGSYGKTGAAVLGAKSCLRAGAGLLTVHIPKCGYSILQASVPEAMSDMDEDDFIFSGIKHPLPYSAVAVGPGIGTDLRTQQALKILIQETHVPMILDADALNILSENKTWLHFIPKNSILTPHPGEFARLAGKTFSGYDAHILQKEFAVKFGVYLVLKGAYTAIATPEGDVYFNSTGNPGMATAGSGDTLTGILLGLCAQGYAPKQAAILGVYLHGLAGDFAEEESGQEALMAGDITHHLGAAFHRIWKME
jgi:ADP-dependent NAD(P)H-hydrate dehydratase / NAD(P)H-hydrate epimerase